MEQILFRQDSLHKLAGAITGQEKLSIVHEDLKKRCPGVNRVSVALYDSQMQVVKTYTASPAEESPLKNYEVLLDEQSDLARLSKEKTPRIINDLRVYENHTSMHSRAIVGHGFASSYTYPFYRDQALAGFIFFNSLHNRYFRDRNLELIEVYARLLAEVTMKDLDASRTLLAVMRTSIGFMQKHDVETASHLERISRYARLIAQTIVKHGSEALDDEQIEQLTLFAPLHDIGKIGIPDRLLQKPAKLDRQERVIMDSHPLLGRQIVEDLITNFGFEKIPYIDYLRGITEEHHEAVDGSGYPHGLLGREISLAARIVAVADVFDALTTRRPYKASWSNEHAFAMLQLLSIDKLDKNCVCALCSNPINVTQIQNQFYEKASDSSSGKTALM